MCGSLGEAAANRSLLDVVERVLSQLGVEATTDAQLGSLPALRPELVDAPGTAVTTFRRQIAIADAVIIAALEAFTNAVVRSTRATADERAAISEAVAGSLGIHRHLAIDSIADFADFAGFD